jgi:murein DD-endopeptidase MepM/ murein hydrolase activator NlpD
MIITGTRPVAEGVGGNGGGFGGTPGYGPPMPEPDEDFSQEEIDRLFCNLLNDFYDTNPTGGDPHGDDPTGGREFGDSRGNRDHNGWDVEGEPGQTVVAPASGTVTNIGIVYEDTTEFTYVEITRDDGTGTIRLFYVDADVQEGDYVTEGQAIGILQDVAAHHGNNMINHIHIEMRDANGNLYDPRPRFLAACAESGHGG